MMRWLRSLEKRGIEFRDDPEAGLRGLGQTGKLVILWELSVSTDLVEIVMSCLHFSSPLFIEEASVPQLSEIVLQVFLSQSGTIRAYRDA